MDSFIQLPSDNSIATLHHPHQPVHGPYFDDTTLLRVLQAHPLSLSSAMATTEVTPLARHVGKMMTTTTMPPDAIQLLTY